MIRSTTAARPLSRGFANVISARAGFGPTIRKASVTTQFHSLAAKRPQVASPPQFRPVHIITQLRYVTKTGVPKHDKIDVEAEKKIASAKLERNPEAVTTDSSVRQVFESSQAPAEEDNEVLRGVKDDFVSLNLVSLAGLRTESHFVILPNFHSKRSKTPSLSVRCLENRTT